MIARSPVRTFLLLLAFSGPVLAQSPTPQSEAKEKRIYMIGNSLTDQVRYESFQKLAESRGYRHIWGRSMTPGAPINWHWKNVPAFTQGPFGEFRKALSGYEWDAVTLQPFAGYRDELEAAKNMVGLLKERNSGAQVYVYAQWMGTTAGDFDRVFTAKPADGQPKASEREIRAFYDRFVPELRAAFPDLKPALLIPAGHAMYLLSQKIQAGQVPGFTSVWQLYNDGIHISNVGDYIVACSFFATIYGESPVGLPFEPYNKIKGRSDRRITPELAKIIQETVWETVTGNPLTGVTAPQTPVAVASPRLATAVAGEPYEFQLLPAFGQPPYRWSATGLPAGFALSGEGVLIGKGGAPGTTKVNVTVTDAQKRSATRELPLVTVADATPKIADAKLPDAPAGKYLSLAIKVDGGNPPFLWVADTKLMPPGLTLMNDGTLQGTPVVPGEYAFPVKVVDGDGATPEEARETLTLTVTPPAADVVVSRQVQGFKHDGVLDEPFWKLDHEVRKPAKGTPAATAKFDVVGAGDSLVIGVDVTDPAVKENAQDIAAGSSVDVYLDLKNNREATYNFDDRRITISPSGKRKVVGNDAVLGVRTAKTEQGYRVELSLPSYNTGIRVKNTAIGVDVGVTDANGNRAVWRGSATNDTDPSQFGTVLLPAEEKK